MSTPSPAFYKWVQRESKGDVEAATKILYDMLQVNQSPDSMVWEVLLLTGDEDYTQESFRKAAKLILEAVQ